MPTNKQKGIAHLGKIQTFIQQSNLGFLYTYFLCLFSSTRNLFDLLPLSFDRLTILLKIGFSSLNISTFRRNKIQ